MNKIYWPNSMTALNSIDFYAYEAISWMEVTFIKGEINLFLLKAANFYWIYASDSWELEWISQAYIACRSKNGLLVCVVGLSYHPILKQQSCRFGRDSLSFHALDWGVNKRCCRFEGWELWHNLGAFLQFYQVCFKKNVPLQNFGSDIFQKYDT